MDPDGVIRLVGKILAGVPSLPLAACRGRHELFDQVPNEAPDKRTERAAAARRLCRDCRERHHCPTC